MFKYGKKELILEGVRIIFRNLEGRGDKFNRAGNRCFSVLIDDPRTAIQLQSEGWNVKSSKPKNSGDNIYWYLPVTVNLSGNTKVYLITDQRILLKEDDVYLVDEMELAYADLILRAYDWEVNGKHGRKAYLNTGYFVARIDKFASKYQGMGDGNGDMF